MGETLNGLIAGIVMIIVCNGFTYDSNIHLENVKVKVAQSCPTLCDPMDYTVCGILQVGVQGGLKFSHISSRRVWDTF